MYHHSHSNTTRQIVVTHTHPYAIVHGGFGQLQYSALSPVAMVPLWPATLSNNHFHSSRWHDAQQLCCQDSHLADTDVSLESPTESLQHCAQSFV